MLNPDKALASPRLIWAAFLRQFPAPSRPSAASRLRRSQNRPCAGNLADVESGNYAILGWRCISPTLIGARMILKNRELPVGTIPSRSVNDRIHPLQTNMGGPYPVFVADGSSTPVLSLCSTTGAEAPVSATFYLSRID